ncbi:MAG: hypothetical protein KKE24_04185 [Candidatus Thermoplasmatota archaeon]|nr:hypothetical protein [Candidatus Thermoplasmatota archaeon]
MNRFRMRMLLMFSTSIIAILVFSRMSSYSLFVLAFGALIMLIAFASYYRPAGLFGLFIVAISATMSMQIDTLIETGPMIAVAVGMLIPMTLLTLFALSSESDGENGYFQRRPVFLGAAYIGCCLLSVAVVIAITGLVFPHMSLRFYGLMEISILLMVSAVLAIALTSRDPE